MQASRFFPCSPELATTFFFVPGTSEAIVLGCRLDCSSMNAIAECCRQDRKDGCLNRLGPRRSTVVTGQGD
jgi:hypothetical protein